MAALIKSQIIKRLSKFVKNLSSKQINLSTLRGEGELSSIILDEKALEDVVELPTWLKIQKATCGRLFIKIPWTNLKTLPIQLQLDDVIIEIVTCEKLRDLHNPSGGNDPSIGKYGFTNRVIDGISLTITNLTFAIKAKGFQASIILPSLDIYSITPNGKRVDTLTQTRLRNTTKDHILLFKEISWPNVRIEASSNDKAVPGTAIRFIINSCQIRILMKKNLQDSTMVASRVMIKFDDLLSVFNDAQFKSALAAYQEITQLMKQASEQKKLIAGDKLTRLERQPQLPTLGTNGSTNPAIAQQLNDLFSRYDLIETSIHFNAKRLDLHIIADSDVPSSADRLVENGALQLTIANLSIDHYPYHIFGSSKKHWIKYNESQSLNRHEWASKLHDEWHEQLRIAKASVPQDDVSVKLEKGLRANHIRLFESCSVVNIDDVVFYPVALNNDQQHKRRRPLIASDKTYYQLPDSLGVINIQYTEYYYPLPYSFPVPNSDLYIQIMPLVFRIDFETTSWVDAFVSTLSITIDTSGILKTDGSNTDLEHMAIKVEAMLPRVVISSEILSKPHDVQQCENLELNISKLLITNTRIETTSHRNQLEKHLNLFKATNFFQQNQWPFSNSTTTCISPLFSKHPYETYLYKNPLSKKTGVLLEPPSNRKALHTYFTMTTDSLKRSAKYDIWHFSAENVYLDFTPSSSDSIRLVKQNMTETLSVTGWTVLDEKEKNPWANVLCILEAPSLLKISQKQYTFIMSLVDELGLFLDVLEHNKNQTRLIKQKYSLNNAFDEMKITICLTSPTTFTLTVIDGLENAISALPTPPQSNLPEVEIEPIVPNTSSANDVIDLVTTPVPIVASTAKVEPPVQFKGQRKSKFEESFHRGLEMFSKGTSINMSDNSDETASQWDLAEDLDADLDASLFNPDFEQQHEKAARIELDDDCKSLTEKNHIGKTTLESVNGVFVKLNQINVCITEDDDKDGSPMYVACNIKYLRIDEFSSLKFNTIKPKLFEKENPDELNHENVPPINVRVDLPKDASKPPPIVTLQVQDRVLTITSHAIDVLTQNLEEIFTPEEKLIRQNQPLKLAPIDARLSNVELTVEMVQEHSTTQAVVDIKPPVKVSIECLHVLRQIDGQVVIQKPNDEKDKKQIIPTLPKSNSNDDVDDKSRQIEILRLENEQLRTELYVLRVERDDLMNTISKLDNGLFQSENQRVTQ